jgi:undecaprenyl diphosphate synthase
MTKREYSVGKSLLLTLKRSTGLPRHIAIIMDGNGRWAKQRGLPRVIGHREGIRSVRDIVEACGELGIGVLTLYTFSTENWRRPEEEISALMKLLLRTMRKETGQLKKNNVRLFLSGDVHKLPPGTRKAMLEGIAETESNTGLVLNLALNYGSREEILHAVRSIAGKVRKGDIDPDGITAETIQAHLYTGLLPDPDLLIRTSGEFRLSNFLLWQLAYTEIVITDVLWPDFRRGHLCAAIQEYLSRERRFGKVGEQIV